MTVTEKDLARQSAAVRKDEEKRRLDYAKLVDMIRMANAQDEALSYDRIAKSTELSKTQVQRILGR
jgi:hypothetical protein